MHVTGDQRALPDPPWEARLDVLAREQSLVEARHLYAEARRRVAARRLEELEAERQVIRAKRRPHRRKTLELLDSEFEEVLAEERRLDEDCRRLDAEGRRLRSATAEVKLRLAEERRRHDSAPSPDEPQAPVHGEDQMDPEQDRPAEEGTPVERPSSPDGLLRRARSLVASELLPRSSQGRMAATIRRVLGPPQAGTDPLRRPTRGSEPPGPEPPEPAR